jgi:hypothetical protein
MDAVTSEPTGTEIPASAAPALSAPTATEVAPAVAVPAVAGPAVAVPAPAVVPVAPAAEAQPVAKVRIDTPGVTIDIEASESLECVAATALRLFREAGGWPKDQNRATGFAQIERRDAPPAQASSMREAPGAYPIQAP